MILATLLLNFLLAAPHASADAATDQAPRASKKVLDLGELEVDGEVRRPNVNWVDSQKRVREMLPELHRGEFHAIEETLLKPARIQAIRAKLSQKGKELTRAGH